MFVFKDREWSPNCFADIVYAGKAVSEYCEVGGEEGGRIKA